MRKLKPFFTTLLAIAVLCIGLIGAKPAMAITFDFSWKGNGGYTAQGSFSYEEEQKNSTITNTNLESLKISFSDPANKFLKSYVLVKDGQDTGVNPYLEFSFDPATKSFTSGSGFDVGEGRTTGDNDYYLHGTIDTILDLRHLDTNVLDTNSGVINVKKASGEKDD
ncbi:hypothetical protein G7B40_027690 [Aetokthonos hydrillicola Thurmond2011]|jgi:hypothetical protein|uniref:Uncharacterized protein n=1 Tax=Aetokthonos hydrillicola Thurmond2011 TaxID=2712845 RepID=A0AAP5IB61_9CYAN|nr:hypothetical protein [Aetokthonos hydrillicola]MBO3459193.1 hypothetical protein [Aetokthonos hydrillicola CCALA 1050]MBW4584152.1 hypothetical protein [Aetokthonos hydrillicola CCALA 1050]MDR9898315.1 hypothetical protein [Aetokthonos hydrillicola Thurmond2011]